MKIICILIKKYEKIMKFVKNNQIGNEKIINQI